MCALVSLEELIVQTNLDQQSCARLKEELSKFSVWLSKNSARYFVTEYETPSEEYLQKSRF